MAHIPLDWNPSVDRLEAHYVLYFMKLVKDSPYKNVRGKAAEILLQVLKDPQLVKRVLPYLRGRIRSKYFLKHFEQFLEPNIRQLFSIPGVARDKPSQASLSEHLRWYIGHCMKHFKTQEK